MNARRTVRRIVLALLAATCAACHFHGGCCPTWGYHVHVPARHCR